MRGALEEIAIARFGLQMRVPAGKEKPLGRLFRAGGGGPVIEMLQNRMHEGSSKGILSTVRNLNIRGHCLKSFAREGERAACLLMSQPYIGLPTHWLARI